MTFCVKKFRDAANWDSKFLLASVSYFQDYTIPTRNEGIYNSRQDKKKDVHNLGTLTKTENQKYVQDNKRLRSLSIQFSVANKNKSQDKPPPILKNLEDREEARIETQQLSWRLKIKSLPFPTQCKPSCI